jgi:hypothetical protein
MRKSSECTSTSASSPEVQMFDAPRWGDDPRHRDDARWPERDRDARDREYRLRGSETRTTYLRVGLQPAVQSASTMSAG